MNPPLVSVIMATHDDQLFLKLAVESILGQSLNNLELIVIDDFSTDSTWQILKSIKDKRLILKRNLKHEGLTRSLNKALKASKGQYIARMDSDDISKIDRLKTQIDYLTNHPDIAAVGSWIQYIDKNGKYLKVKKLPKSYTNIKNAIPRFNPFIHPTLVFRSEMLKKIGGYDKTFYCAQDYDLMLRINANHKTANIPKVLLYYRVSNSQISSANMTKQLKFAQKARIKAFMEGNLQKWQIIYLVKPLLSLLIPQTLKKPIIDLFVR